MCWFSLDICVLYSFFFSSRRRHTRCYRDWSSDVCSSDLFVTFEKDGGDLLGHYLSESYKAEETYGSAFGKLFARLFAKQGLILMDPLDAGLHKVAAPLYQHALAERDPLNLKLLERGKGLERAGFDAQVKVTSKSTLLFYMGDGARQAISGGNKDFEAGERSWPRDELVHLTHLEPENFSPNALFRPVVQDYLLPTAAFIVGPPELSYIAQPEW